MGCPVVCHMGCPGRRSPERSIMTWTPPYLRCPPIGGVSTLYLAGGQGGQEKSVSSKGEAAHHVLPLSWLPVRGSKLVLGTECTCCQVEARWGSNRARVDGTARRMCMGFIDDMTQKLSMGGISVPLIASKEDCLEHLCVGFKPNTLSTAVWKSNSELGYPENYCGGNLASMAWNLRAIEHMLLRGRRRVDGVGRPKFDFHTGRRKKRSSSASSARKRRRIRFRWRGRKLRSGGPGAKLRRSGCSNARHPSQVLTSLVSRSER